MTATTAADKIRVWIRDSIVNRETSSTERSKTYFSGVEEGLNIALRIVEQETKRDV